VTTLAALSRRLRLVLCLVALSVIGAAGVERSHAAPNVLVGIYDDTQILYGNPDQTFPLLRTLRSEILRVDLFWGGAAGVARRKPTNGANPADTAYNWAVYDRTVQYAARSGIKVVFSIWGTPAWANGGRGLNAAPVSAAQLERFAYAAARRYSGTYRGPDGRVLPAVRLWMAWNEPNFRTFLAPQYRRVGGRYIMQSAIDYARICNAVYNGVHRTMVANEKVACGVTGPGGNNNPNSDRPSVSPLAFMRAMKKAGVRRFDAYAHHPYYRNRDDTPSTRLPENASRIMLGNIDSLTRELTRLYGPKRLWITEYGFQTNPPDRGVFGISWARQAQYVRESFAIARKHPRIDMLLWFLLRDETRLEGWQSGLLTASGRRKPAFTAFQRLPR